MNDTDELMSNIVIHDFSKAEFACNERTALEIIIMGYIKRVKALDVPDFFIIHTLFTEISLMLSDDFKLCSRHQGLIMAVVYELNDGLLTARRDGNVRIEKRVKECANNALEFFKSRVALIDASVAAGVMQRGERNE